MGFQLHSHIRNDSIGKLPDGRVACIVWSAARNISVISVASLHLEELPCCPGTAVPNQQLHHVVFHNTVILVRPQNFVGTAGNFQSGGKFFHQFRWQRIKAGQPGLIVILRDFDDLSGQHHDESFRPITGFCHVISPPDFNSRVTPLLYMA